MPGLLFVLLFLRDVSLDGQTHGLTFHGRARLSDLGPADGLPACLPMPATEEQLVEISPAGLLLRSVVGLR